MLADIVPTSYEVGVRNGGVKPGDTVVIVGAGPIGLAPITNAQLFAPSTIIVVDKSSPTGSGSTKWTRRTTSSPTRRTATP
ncbi:hypothetical protein AB0F15_11950 [Amycolatopsis sp. NPDC026612]|uniref:hypothetical protein n=1 Tax=Amycolatopsis sp. NPDC026612 TaxID=3155466 RepID=UPI0033DD4F08